MLAVVVTKFFITRRINIWDRYLLFGCLAGYLVLGLQLWVYLRISESCISFKNREVYLIWGLYCYCANLFFSVVPIFIGSFGKFIPLFISYEWQPRNFLWCLGRSKFLLLVLSFTIWFGSLIVDAWLGVCISINPCPENLELWIAFSSCLKLFSSRFTLGCYFFKTLQSLFRIIEYLTATFLFVSELQSTVSILLSINKIRIYFFLAYLLFNLLISNI